MFRIDHVSVNQRINMKQLRRVISRSQIQYKEEPVLHKVNALSKKLLLLTLQSHSTCTLEHLIIDNHASISDSAALRCPGTANPCCLWTSLQHRPCSKWQLHSRGEQHPHCTARQHALRRLLVSMGWHGYFSRRLDSIDPRSPSRRWRCSVSQLKASSMLRP